MPIGIYIRTKSAWNKGKHLIHSGSFKKGHGRIGETGPKKGSIPWNKGLKGFHSPTKGKLLLAVTDEKHHCWKGDEVGYRSLHGWIRRKKGKPIKCIFCGKEKTTPKSIQWANINHKYRRNLEDWISLCAFCHYHYDNDKKQLIVL
jgi:hypothetical protein